LVSLLRYADLEARGIVSNRVQLKRLQEHYGFPRGRMLSPNTRTWSEQEIEEWYASRPVEEPGALRGVARIKHEKKQAETATE
jgi:Prophage CP4-57 regulatory protein (AlpA)